MRNWMKSGVYEFMNKCPGLLQASNWSCHSVARSFRTALVNGALRRAAKKPLNFGIPRPGKTGHQLEAEATSHFFKTGTCLHSRKLRAEREYALFPIDRHSLPFLPAAQIRVRRYA